MSSFFLLLIAILPRLDGPVCERVDLIEVNHHHDENCRLIMTQQIFYEWNRGRYDVIAWRMVKSPIQLPYRDWQDGGYVCFWKDGDIMRKVRAEAFRETWTQAGLSGDPEVNEREMLPKERRKELKGNRR
jgi:hypothetical protein